MAKIKPVGQSSKLGSITMASKLNAIGTACDVIGMTEVPIVDQAACVVGAIAYGLAGQPVDAALSLGSLIPGAGKVADATKIARKTQKIAETSAKVVKNADKVTDAAKAAGKNAKFGEITRTQKLKELEEAAANSAKKSSPQKPASTPKAQPTPAATQAKSPKIEGPKEVQQTGSKFDTGSTNNINNVDLGKELQNSLHSPSNTDRGITHTNYYGYQSSPATSNVFTNTGKSYPF